MVEKHSIVSALQQRGCDPHHDGEGWRAKCPCHEGTTANSLAISADGKMHCFGCEANTGDILKELGLVEKSQSFTTKQKVVIDGKPVTLHESEQAAIDATAWSVCTKAKIPQRPPDRLHRYHEADGTHVFTVVVWKFSPESKDARQLRTHDGGWICKAMKAARPLYHLPDVIEASSVVVCEGEKTTEALRSIGLVATTPSQGAMSPKKTDWSVLAEKSVTITVDNDDAGREFGKLVIELLPESVVSVKVVELKDDWSELPVKGDAADWVEQFADVDHTTLRNRFKALPDHFETISAIVPKKKQREREAVVNETILPNAVELVLDEMLVNDQVVKLLAARGDLFDHNGCLAIVVDEHVDSEASRKTIQHLSLATVREFVSTTCRFFTWEETKEGEAYPSWERVPRWSYEAVLARGHYAEMRPIRGIVTSPVLRADGSILQEAGYDIDSGLYVDLSEAFPTITSNPTSAAIKDAVAMLFDLVSDFPFANDASRSGWLASLLTPLAREAYRGCTGPMFLFDANVRGSGKSLLADINALIVVGREATRLTAPRDDDEARKRITALVNDSDRIVLIDNVSGRFGCSAFDAALTGSVWKDRRLGHSETIEAPLRMSWYASGNNVLLGEDTARRTCHVRLESPLENPEDRDGFKYPDIRKHVRQHRPALLTAALTILRGFIAAKRPDQRLKPWGSFEGWSDLVRATIVWCGLADPGETRTMLRQTSDSEAGSLRQMLNAVVHVDQDQHGLRTSDMLKIATARDQSYAADDVETMRDAIECFCGRSIVKASAQHLGNRLSHFRNRVVYQMAFDCTGKGGSNYWFVQLTVGPVGPVVPDSANLRGTEIIDVESTPNEIPSQETGQNRYYTSYRSYKENPNIDWIDGTNL